MLQQRVTLLKQTARSAPPSRDYRNCSVERFRTQEQSRKDARDRLAGLLRRAPFVPRPRIAIRPTRPRRSAPSRRRSGGARPSARGEL